MAITALETLSQQMAALSDLESEAFIQLVAQREQVIGRLMGICSAEQLAQWPDLQARLSNVIQADAACIAQLEVIQQAVGQELQQTDQGRSAVSAYSHTLSESTPAHYVDTHDLN